MGPASDAIEAAVASVTDDADAASVAAALRSVTPAQVDAVLDGTDRRPTSPPSGDLLAEGAGVSPGTSTGIVCTSATDLLDLADAGAAAVLWVDATSPADEPAMRLAAAVVTATGGPASHAAIVARQWGVPAVCSVGHRPPPAGLLVTVDGAAGTVRAASGPVAGPDASDMARPGVLPPALEVLLDLADAVVAGRTLVTANAETAGDVALARRLGAVGVGLCRTEHQFTGPAAPLVRPVLEGTADDAALAALAAAQAGGLTEVLTAADGALVKVRLLDAPLHEFLEDHGEANPMLGLRGARLALVRPGLVEAQVGALLDAADAAMAMRVAVTVPMVASVDEFLAVAERVREAVRHHGSSTAVEVGAMVETPRAALVADALAEVADYLSFGTNDLTQLVWGLSRDDVHADLRAAQADGGLDPFTSFDLGGVGPLVADAVDRARAVVPGVPVSVCGEHAADPVAVGFLCRAGVDELSVAPRRVPSVRLAVAQAWLGAVA